MANSIKDLVGSVDWGKMLSRSDTRNALVGSALGAALLGGAGLMQKRDPEESKLAPVGDALMGAVLGGVAGYGIPKGLALFRDSGSLAPDGDVLKTKYLKWGLGGAAAGTGLFGASFYKTLARVKGQLGEQARNNLANARTAAHEDVIRAWRKGTTPKELDMLLQKSRILDTSTLGEADTERLMARYRRRILGGYLRHKTNRPWFKNLVKEYKELRDFRNEHIRGYSTWRNLMSHVSQEKLPGGTGDAAKGFWRSLLSHSRGNRIFSTHGIHYKPEALMWLGPVVGPHLRPLVRGGKYALAGTALGLLAHKLFGPSASDNFKN